MISSFIHYIYIYMNEDVCVYVCICFVYIYIHVLGPSVNFSVGYNSES